MPTSRAASRLAAVANMALPASVRVKKAHSAATISATPSSTTRLCGSSAAPPMIKGWLPKSGGRL